VVAVVVGVVAGGGGGVTAGLVVVVGRVVGVGGRGWVNGFVVGGPDCAPPACDASPKTATDPVCNATR
jgi:hypothetical protein